MDIGDIIYLAFATLLVIVLLHLGVFWISRVIQPPRPKIVYVQQPTVPQVTPPMTQPTYNEQPQKVQVPAYDTPAPSSTPISMGQLPPPIETRQTK